jgi:hypothetical protein
MIFDTQKLTTALFTIHTQTYIRAQQVYHAALVCQYTSPQIYIDHNFQWELGKTVDAYRVTFLADRHTTYEEIEQNLVGCMKSLRS